MTDALIAAPLREAVQWPTIRRHGGLGTHLHACRVDVRRARADRWAGSGPLKSGPKARHPAGSSRAIARMTDYRQYRSSQPGQGFMRQIQAIDGPAIGLSPASMYRQD